MRSLEQDVTAGQRTIQGIPPTAGAGGGVGWHSIRNAAGDYSIFFDKPFRGTPHVNASPSSTVAGNLPRVTEWDAFHIRVVNNAGAVDFNVEFTARGLA